MDEEKEKNRLCVCLRNRRRLGVCFGKKEKFRVFVLERRRSLEKGRACLCY